MRRYSVALLALVVIAAASLAGAPGDRMVGINVVLKSAPSGDMLATLNTYGKVRDIIPEINALTMQVAQSRAAAVGKLSFVEAWGFDAKKAEIALETAAIALPAGCRSVTGPSGVASNICWGADATGAGFVHAGEILK